MLSAKSPHQIKSEVRSSNGEGYNTQILLHLSRNGKARKHGQAPKELVFTTEISMRNGFPAPSQSPQLCSLLHSSLKAAAFCTSGLIRPDMALPGAWPHMAPQSYDQQIIGMLSEIELPIPRN